MRFLLLWLLTAGTGMWAAELALDGNFTRLDENRLPVQWVQHRNWDGFKPFASIEVVPGIGKGENALHIFDTRAKHGVSVRTAKRLKGISGDILTVTLKARGQGQGGVGLYYYTQKGEWNQASPQQFFTLTKEWKEHSFTFTIGNGITGETAYYDVTFGGRTGLDAEFTSITVDQEPAKFRGSLPFPKHWTVFAPVNPKFIPSDAQLNGIPALLDGVKAKLEQLQGNELDFAVIMGTQRQELCGWAFAELLSPVECDYTFGVGADWWMTYYLNGTKIIDTTGIGNAKTPFQINNHLATARLRKGRNILAVRLITGAKSSVLMLGGPDDLRSMTRKLKVSEVLSMDDYDNKNVNCPGDPELIQGNPTPGLLSITGQGVYRTADTLTIPLSRTRYEMPSGPEGWFTTGVRIQNFGQTQCRNSSLLFDFRAGRQSFELKVDHGARSGDLLCTFLDNGKVVKKTAVPYKVLPADFQFFASADGKFILSVNSLADSSTNTIRGVSSFFAELGRTPFETKLVFRSGSTEPAEVVIDNYMTGLAVAEEKTSAIPFRIDLLKEFDPVKAGWKLVFSDEFNGTQVDWSKWFERRNSDHASLDGKGNLLIKCDWGPDGKKLKTASLWTKEKFQYGYFEARLKFTKQPGWWAAFWLYGDSNSNPMLDGFEVDIFEDYYIRPKKTGTPGEGILDHNLHVYTGSLLKSWNYNSRLPGFLDDFYVLGCKWTPFEISYYLNGKLISSSANHSSYSSVTFDAFSHAAGITPLHAIISGQVMSESWKSSAKDGHFPEYFIVDYVRVYACPQDDAPSVRWKTLEPGLFAPVGKTLKFAVDAAPSPKTKAPVKTAYLFDNGYLLDCKTAPPYKFEIPFTPDFYAGTSYMKPGRSGKKISFNGYVHSFSIFVQDAVGNIAHTEPVLKVAMPKTAGRPYQGKPQTVPGKIKLGFYDEGEQDVAYHDTTSANLADKNFRPGEAVDAGKSAIGNVISGEWINYTVDIQKAGRYTAELLYGTPFYGEQNLLVFLDGNLLGKFRLFRHDGDHWSCDTLSKLANLSLPAGRHVLTLLATGGFNMASLEFKAE